MKLYVAVRFKGVENKEEVESLCAAVKKAGAEDFCFVRDVENYQKTFDDPKELWERSKEEISSCDGFLMDVTDKPSGGRVIEVGIAYALGLPIFVIAKKATKYKPVFEAIATHLIEYDDLENLSGQLAGMVSKTVQASSALAE